MTVRFATVVALVVLVAAGLHAQSPVPVAAPWACWAQSASASSLFRPAAVNSECESMASAAIRMKPRETARASPIAIPGVPTTLAAAVSGSTVILTWSAPTGADAPTSYVLEAGSASGLSNLANTDTGSPLPSLTATGVPGGTYFVRVRARNAGGTSAASNEIIVTIGGACAGAPGAPTSLSSTVNGSSVSFAWQPPSGVCPVTSYVVEAGSAAGLSNLASVDTGSTAAAFAATGVGAGTYFVRVRAVNGSAVGGASNEITMVVTGAPPAPLAWTPEAVLLTEITAGFPGQSIADSSSLQLRDGRWRMFFTGAGYIRSAISPDGLALTMEPGIRLDLSGALGRGSLASAIRVLRLADGRVRAFFHSLDGMYSAVSSDEGVTFTVEPGVRITAASVGDTEISGGAVVRTRDGLWRMYFGGRAGKVFSAISTDQLAWTLESGVRVGAGAVVGGSAQHPCAISNADGSVSIFYFRDIGQAAPYGIYVATSSDGLTFSSETATGIRVGADPDVVQSGTLIRMYYNWGNNTNGVIYSARPAAR